MNRRSISGLLVVAFMMLGYSCTSAMVDESGEKRVMQKKNTQKKRQRAKRAPLMAVGEIKEADSAQGIVDIDTFVTEFDAQARENAVKRLVDRGVEFCAHNGLVQVCQAFTHTKDFIEGELYLYVLDKKGTVYAHGDQSDLLWKNLFAMQDMFGAFFVQSIIKTAEKAPDWVSYEWNGSVKKSFVQLVHIGDKEYVLGCGYYPHSKKYSTMGLVKGAVGIFNKYIADGALAGNAFSDMSYPLSDKFMFGDLYLYALDFDGNIRAQGERPGLIGSNALDYKDSTGKAYNKEIIEMLKDKKEDEGIWIEYMSKNARKSTYVEKVKDKQGNYYFIACGYYPEIDRDKARDLVDRGYTFMKGSGISVATKEFTDSKINTYRFGDLALFVYDMKGNVIANGHNPEFVGQNQFDLKNSDGRYYVRDMIDLARAGGGWTEFKLNNSFQATYVKKIDMGVGEFVIGAGLFPVSKADTMTLLVKSAMGYLSDHTVEQSCQRFVERNGNFRHGDLFIYMLDQKGFCYAWSDSYPLIWQNLLGWKDDNGKLFIKEMIDASAHGPESLVCALNKDQRVNYFEQIEKDGIAYIIGSGFYK